MNEALHTQINRLNRQALELRYTNLDGAIALSEQAAELSRTELSKGKTYSESLAESLMNLGDLYSQRGNFQQALSHYFKALLAYETISNRTKVTLTLYAIGNCYSTLCDFPNALENYMKALDVARELEDHSCEAVALNGIGSLYMQLEEWHKALPYLDESLHLAEDSGDSSLQSKILDNLSTSLCQVDDYDNALSCGLRSVRLCQETGDLKAEAESLFSIGNVYQKMGDDNQAMNYYQRCLVLSEAIDLKIQPVRAMRSIASLHCNKNNLGRAEEMLCEALRRATSYGVKREQFACHQALALIYKKMGRFEDALTHYESYHGIKEKIFNEEADLRLKTLETNYQAEKARKEAEIYQLKNMALQQEIEQRKQSQAELERIARIDPLTSLYNRRYFFYLAENEFKRSQRYQHPLSMIMLDVDNFKLINDNYGHLIGDQVLVQIAQRINETVREVDISCRFGGEEFLILLPETNMQSARLVAERLRQNISGMLFDTDAGKIPASISLGTADNHSADKLDLVINHADAALYEAKNNGRNQVVMFNGQSVKAWSQKPKSLN